LGKAHSGDSEDNDYNIHFYPQDIAHIAQAEAEGPGSEKQLSVVKRPEARVCLSFLRIPTYTYDAP
jgi:hypothetical protein